MRDLSPIQQLELELLVVELDGEDGTGRRPGADHEVVDRHLGRVPPAELDAGRGSGPTVGQPMRKPKQQVRTTYGTTHPQDHGPGYRESCHGEEYVEMLRNPHECPTRHSGLRRPGAMGKGSASDVGPDPSAAGCPSGFSTADGRAMRGRTWNRRGLGGTSAQSFPCRRPSDTRAARRGRVGSYGPDKD